MSENRLADPESIRPAEPTWVQPREIGEAAFRALISAGAEPGEAAEGAAAVLRAQAHGGTGLALLRRLLDAPWSAPVRAATVTDTTADGVRVRELIVPAQPELRTALQLIDLAVAGPTQAHVLHCAADIPGDLWAELLLSRAARHPHSIVVIGPGAIVASLPADTEGHTVLVVSPRRTAAEPPHDGVPHAPLRMRAADWHEFHRLSRGYLMEEL